MRLTEQEAAVFAYLARTGQVDLVDVKGLTGLNSQAALQLIQRLTVQALLDMPDQGSRIFRLAAPFRARFGAATAVDTHKNQGLSADGVTVQATVQAESIQPSNAPGLVQLSAFQRKIIDLSDTPHTAAELQSATGLKQRAHFVTQHLNPLLDGGVLRRTIPEKPTSPNQQYVLTEAGVKLKALHRQAVPKQVERKSKK